jgi:hypothetical protein
MVAIPDPDVPLRLNAARGHAKIALDKLRVAARERRPSVRHVNANFPNLKPIRWATREP